MRNNFKLKRQNPALAQQEVNHGTEPIPQPGTNLVNLETEVMNLENHQVKPIRDADGFVVPTLKPEKKVDLLIRTEQAIESKRDNRKKRKQNNNNKREKWSDIETYHNDFAYSIELPEIEEGKKKGAVRDGNVFGKGDTLSHCGPPTKLSSLSKGIPLSRDELLDSNKNYISPFDDQIEENDSAAHHNKLIINNYNDEGCSIESQNDQRMSRNQENEEIKNILWEVPQLEDFIFEPDEKPEKKEPLPRCDKKVFHNTHRLPRNDKFKALNQTSRSNYGTIPLRTSNSNKVQSMDDNPTNNNQSNSNNNLMILDMEKKEVCKNLGKVAKIEAGSRLKTFNWSPVKREEVNNVNMDNSKLSTDNNYLEPLRRCNSTGTSNLDKLQLYSRSN